MDGRDTSASLDLTVARSFFQNGQYPADFHRREGAFGVDDIGEDIGTLFQVHPIAPGHNEGAGNYVLNPEDPGFNGVRIVLIVSEVILNIPNPLDVLSIYQTRECHGSLTLPKSHRQAADGSQGEPINILFCFDGWSKFMP